MSNRKKRKCIIHYSGLGEYSEIKTVNEQNEKRILEAKSKREELKGENHHKSQCDSIPEVITKDHGVHITPCYKKFTLILSNSPYDPVPETVRRFSKRTINLDPAWLYPKICGICDKVTAKYQKKKVPLTKIATQNAANNLKECAKTKDLELYSAIEAEDIVAREFQYHKHCLRNFTRKRKSEEPKTMEEPVSYVLSLQSHSCL